MGIYILIIIILAVMWAIGRPKKCPRCGKRMESMYNPHNGVSYNECTGCGHIDIVSTDRYI